MHKIEKLIVINHKDCGAAKIANGKKEFNSINEMKIQWAERVLLWMSFVVGYGPEAPLPQKTNHFINSFN